MDNSERDALLVRIDANVEHLKATKFDHEDRLRGLEKHKHFTLGFAAAVSALISWFMGSR